MYKSVWMNNRKSVLNVEAMELQAAGRRDHAMVCMISSSQEISLLRQATAGDNSATTTFFTGRGRGMATAY
jgi:hypothetical protein